MDAATLDIDNGLATVTISRPDVHNAMNWEVFDGLAKAFDEVGGQSDVRVVVVRGAGTSFSSGIDLNLFSEVANDPVESIGRAQAPFRKLARLEVPTVAAVSGHAYGAGLQLALCCDVRIAASSARLGLLEVRYGLIPDLGGTAILPSLVGAGRAKWMMWTGTKLDAAEAARIGLVEILVEESSFEDEVARLSEGLRDGPPRVLRGIKKLVDDAPRSSFEQGMDHVADAQTKVLSSKDFAEAISAFIEKRKPEFQDR